MMTEYFGVQGEKLLHAADLVRCNASFKDMADLSRSDLEANLDNMDEVQAVCFHHTCPPTALGLRHATLAHKVHAILHSFRLESSSWSSVQGLLDCIFAITSDQGTESEVSLATVPLQSMFPYWTQQGQIEFEVDAGANVDIPEQGAERDPDPDSLSFTKSLYVAGMFHLIDGITKDLLKKSLCWSEVKPLLDAVLQFFHGGHNRQLFVSKCFSEGNRGFEFLFRAGPAKLEGGRAWGVLEKGVDWVLARRHVLRQTWNAAAFGAQPDEAEQGQGEGRDGVQDTSKLVSKVSEAVGSDFFWAYLRMLQCITSILQEISAWTQSCPCHSVETLASLKEVSQARQAGEFVKCPMRGRRAPEVAAGEFAEFINTLVQYNDSRFVMRSVAGLEGEAKDKITLDWSNMKAYIKTACSLKLSAWQHLPLSMLGIGHTDPATARLSAWRSLSEFNELSESAQDAVRPVVRRLLSGDGERQMLAFLREEDSSVWPDLDVFRAQCMFVPILEQSIERRHAVLHQHIKSAPHHSAPFVSVSERKHEILNYVQDKSIDTMAEICESVRAPALVAESLGLQKHPDLAAWWRPERGSLEISTSHAVVAALVYRCDSSAQFLALPSVQKPPRHPQNLPVLLDEAGNQHEIQVVDEAGAAAASSSDAVVPVQPGDSFLTKLMEHHAFQHFCSASTAADVYSIDPSQALPGHSSSLMLPMQQVLTTGLPGARFRVPKCLLDGAATDQASVEFTFEDDCGVPTLPEQQPKHMEIIEGKKHPHVFFRLSSGNIAGKKRMRLDAGFDVTSDHVAVECCAISHFDQTNRQVHLQMSSKEPDLFQRPASMCSFYKWEVVKTCSGLRGIELTPEASAALDLLMTSADNAEEEECLVLSKATEEYKSYEPGLEFLCGAGVVERHELIGDICKWTLTNHGGDKLIPLIIVQKPRCITRMHVDSSKDPGKMTTMELIRRLTDQGFEMQLLPSKSKRIPPAFDLSTKAPKVWWTKETETYSVSRWYLLALLSTESVIAHGHTEVLHCQNNEYYRDLLSLPVRKGKRKHQGQKSLMFQADTGAEPLADASPSAPAPLPLPAPRRELVDREAKEPQADAHPAAKKPVRRGQHDKTFFWGPALLTFSEPNRWQATCPRTCSHRHTLGNKTKCTRTRTFKKPEDEAAILLELKFWVNQAPKFCTRLSHMQECQPPVGLTEELVDSEKLPSDYETGSEQEKPASSKAKPVVSQAKAGGKKQKLSKSQAKTTPEAKGHHVKSTNSSDSESSSSSSSDSNSSSSSSS